MRQPWIGLLAVVVLAAGCVPASVVPGGTDAGVSPAPASVGPTASPSFVRPTPNPSPTFLVYEVKPGDSLTSIARLFGTTARSIAYWNRAGYASLDPDSPTYQPNRIVVGWLLQVIPTAIVDEEDLPDPTPSPSPTPAPPPSSSRLGASASPS